MDKRRFLIAGAMLLMPGTVLAAEPFVYTGLVPGLGAGGYDVISYLSGKPVAGSTKFSHNWRDAEWRFATAENLAQFKESPDAYLPQYGGYCAYALAKGALAKGDPEAWTLHDGKLYLNFSKSVRETWSQDIPGHVTAANANWPKALE